MLQAGVMEDGGFMPTYSGTPQGGLASPILSNIVLHEFDCWLEDHWKANPPRLTRKQQDARVSPEYARHKRNLVRWRAQLAGRIPMGRQTPEGLRLKIKQALEARARIPSVRARRMLSFCRYADDVRHLTRCSIPLRERRSSEEMTSGSLSLPGGES
jgi:retron-type reverse transcriptase